MIPYEKYKSRLLTLFLVIIVCGCSTRPFVSSHSSVTDVADRIHASDNTSTRSLRDVFIEHKSGLAPSAIVGRLAVRLIENGGSRMVRVDHEFRSGDRFQFEISSNMNGWLYIFHRSQNGKPQLLWPRPAPDKKNTYLDSNEIQAGQTYIVPSYPGVFVMDEEVGNEIFSVLITSRKKLKEPHPIIQFAVRRGVIFDPGKDDADKHIYFSPRPDDHKADPMIEFQLRHE